MTIYDLTPSVLAQGAEKLNMPRSLLKNAVKWVAELPPAVREELLETVKRPMCGSPRNATLVP